MNTKYRKTRCVRNQLGFSFIALTFPSPHPYCAQLLHVCNLWVTIYFLDAIASPCNYPCQWVSESVSGSVGDSFRRDAIPSPSFARLFHHSPTIWHLSSAQNFIFSQFYFHQNMSQRQRIIWWHSIQISLWAPLGRPRSALASCQRHRHQDPHHCHHHQD